MAQLPNPRARSASGTPTPAPTAKTGFLSLSGHFVGEDVEHAVLDEALAFALTLRGLSAEPPMIDLAWNL